MSNGLFSIPSKFGIPAALWIARGTHLIALAFLILLGVQTPELQTLYWIGAFIAAALLIGLAIGIRLPHKFIPIQTAVAQTTPAQPATRGLPPGPPCGADSSAGSSCS